MDLQLTNRVALVTAASQGLGYATALQFSREGALVAICSRDEARINAAADAIHTETGNPAIGIPGDLRNPEHIDELIDRVIDEYGGLDILVTNSGGPPSTTFEELTDETWIDSIDLIIMSAVRLIRKALPYLRESTAPSVLTVTSLSTKQPMPNMILSNSLRMTVVGITKTLANELGPEGIRFNSILPAWTETERIQELMEVRAGLNQSTIEEEIQKQSMMAPLRRISTPQEFANVAVFLASPAASYLTGLMVPVDGGLYKGTF